MTTFGSFEGFGADPRPAAHDDLAEIMLRADSLGFSRHRVATALRITPQDLALIEHRSGPATAAGSTGESSPAAP